MASDGHLICLITECRVNTESIKLARMTSFGELFCTSYPVMCVTGEVPCGKGCVGREVPSVSRDVSGNECRVASDVSGVKCCVSGDVPGS